MTTEDKDLLLKDLCARLPYWIKGIITYNKSNTAFTVEGIDNNVLHLSDAEECCVEDFKPYLRSMSSMTEEERKEYKHLIAFSGSPDGSANFINWLNKKMFAYRTIDGKDMFELCLAIKAPNDMYK